MTGPCAWFKPWMKTSARRPLFAEKAPAEIRAAATPQPPTDPGGRHRLCRNERRPAGLLRALVESYAVDMPIEVAKAWLDEIASAGSETCSSPGPARPTAARGMPIAFRGRRS